MLSAELRDAPPLTSEEAREQRAAFLRLCGELVAVGTTEPALVSSVFVGSRRYDSWRSVEILEGTRALPELAAVPLVTWLLHVRAPGLEYVSHYEGPPFPVEGLDRLAPERAADRLAVVDARAYDGRQLELAPYRRRAAARPREVAANHELALMIWFQHFSGAPGPVLEAERPLRRALERSPRAHALHGLLGEILLRSERDAEAARAFEEAARLHPRHPRYHYCASVALEGAGEAAASKRALATAKRQAGPRLRDRFTRASNPLEDYRFSLIGQVTRVRKHREGIAPVSDREMAEGCREENRADPARVPEDLRALVPLAERWGIGDDVARGYFLRRATREDKAALRAALASHADRISGWLDSLGPEGIVTPEAGCFLYLLEACAELGLRPGKTRRRGRSARP